MTDEAARAYRLFKRREKAVRGGARLPTEEELLRGMPFLRDDLTGDMPSRRSSWQMPALVESPYARAFLEQLDRVRSPPKVPEWERIATEMRLAGERVVQRVQTIDEAVVALDRKTDEILAKRRWMLERNTLPGAS